MNLGGASAGVEDEWVGFNTRPADFSVYLDLVPLDVEQRAVERAARDMRCAVEFVGLWQRDEAAGTACWKLTFYAKRDARRFARHMAGTTPWGGAPMRARMGTPRDRCLVRSVMTFRQCVQALNAIATPFGWSNSVPFTLTRPKPLRPRSDALASGRQGAGGTWTEAAPPAAMGGRPGSMEPPSLTSAASLGLFAVANAALAALPPDIFDHAPPPQPLPSALGVDDGEASAVGDREPRADDAGESGAGEAMDTDGGAIGPQSLWVVNGVGACTQEQWGRQSCRLPAGVSLPKSCAREQRSIPAPYLGMPGPGAEHIKPPRPGEPGPCVHIGMAVHLHGCRLTEWATLPTETVVAHGGCTCELRTAALASMSKFSSPDAHNLNSALMGGGGDGGGGGGGCGDAGGSSVISPITAAWGTFGAMPQAPPPPTWNTLPPTCPVAHCAVVSQAQSDVRPWTMQTALVQGDARNDRIGVHVASAVQLAFQSVCEKVQLRMVWPRIAGAGTPSPVSTGGTATSHPVDGGASPLAAVGTVKLRA